MRWLRPHSVPIGTAARLSIGSLQPSPSLTLSGCCETIQQNTVCGARAGVDRRWRLRPLDGKPKGFMALSANLLPLAVEQWAEQR